MPAFKFKMAQHVTVPTLGVPGRVYRRIDTAGAENTYFLVYLNEICGPALLDRAVSESELISAQPVPVEEQVAARVVAAVGKAEKTPLPPVPSFREMRGILKPRKRSRSKRRAKR
jgi:hypothetical protein